MWLVRLKGGWVPGGGAGIMGRCSGRRFSFVFLGLASNGRGKIDLLFTRWCFFVSSSDGFIDPG